ncbi:CBS domain-containing protein [Novipirellula artificiosorum]|uniref:CBS domain protein n=1 Tax=Novipirellula artificiosorum TaxID=2528016 RepID=A0A5C6DTQ4_9BACT|nr:CBS domain-containing protein [Novipirellula artificiosorum]TWU39584.1 CBS domain protein [Novipirellula artificiosorum]
MTTVEYLTTECPNGHRVRGDLGWLNREVRCPHCQTQFVFSRPIDGAAKVLAVAHQEEEERDPLSDTGVMKILDEFQIPERPKASGIRRCADCGAIFPTDVETCYNCNTPLGAIETPSKGGDADRELSAAETIDFRAVNGFPLENATLRELMRPRKEMIALDVNDSRAKMLDRVHASGHANYVVCDRSLDAFVGIVSAESLIFSHDDNFEIRALTTPVRTVPDTMLASELADVFRYGGDAIVLVEDEHDTIVGMLTRKEFSLKLLASIR